SAIERYSTGFLKIAVPNCASRAGGGRYDSIRFASYGSSLPTRPAVSDLDKTFAGLGNRWAGAASVLDRLDGGRYLRTFLYSSSPSVQRLCHESPRIPGVGALCALL